MKRKTVSFKPIFKFNTIPIKILINILMELVKSNSDLEKIMQK